MKPRPQAGARGRRRSAMKIFLLQGTKQLGPYSADEIRSRITSGEVALSTLAWAEGMQDWVPVSEILLDGAQSSPPLPISTSIESPITRAETTYSPKKKPRKRNRDLAICGLAFGIIGAWFAPLAIPAVICGHMALAKLKKFPKRYGGKGMAMTGVILGWLGVAIGIPAMIFLISMEVLTKDLREEVLKWEQEREEEQREDFIRKGAERAAERAAESLRESIERQSLREYLQEPIDSQR